MANDTNKILEKILQKESLQAKKLCELIEALGEGSGPGPGEIQYQVTVEQACDKLDDQYIPIEIIKHFENGVYQSLEYRDLEGNPYVLVGQIGLCSTESIQQEYNNVEQQLVTSGSLTLQANTIHAVSYKVLSGTVNITIGNVTLPYKMGEADSEQATTLIAQEYSFAPLANSSIKVKTIF